MEFCDAMCFRNPRCESRHLIEFFRGRPRGGDNFTSFSKCSRPFFSKSSEAPFLTLRVATKVAFDTVRGKHRLGVPKLGNVFVTNRILEIQVCCAGSDQGHLCMREGGSFRTSSQALQRALTLTNYHRAHRPKKIVLQFTSYFGDWARKGQNVPNARGWGELAPKVAPRRLGLLTLELTIFYTESVKKGVDFGGALEIQTFHPPL